MRQVGLDFGRPGRVGNEISNGYCLARCTPFDLFGNIVYRCPTGLTCSGGAGGVCIAQ